MGKKSFLLYIDSYDAIKDLSTEQKGLLFDAIFIKQIENEVTINDPVVKMAFNFIQNQISRDKEKYKTTCEKNRENINKRWSRKSTTEYDRIRPNTKHTDNDNDNDNDSDNDNVNDKEINIYIPQIIAYLNDHGDKQFKTKSAKTAKLIKARLAEGFMLEDFKKVIDNKIRSWIDDPEMNKYLRPETLFGNKFEAYLNETPVKQKIKIERAS